MLPVWKISYVYCGLLGTSPNLFYQCEKSTISNLAYLGMIWIYLAGVEIKLHHVRLTGGNLKSIVPVWKPTCIYVRLLGVNLNLFCRCRNQAISILAYLGATWICFASARTKLHLFGVFGSLGGQLHIGNVGKSSFQAGGNRFSLILTVAN